MRLAARSGVVLAALSVALATAAAPAGATRDECLAKASGSGYVRGHSKLAVYTRHGKLWACWYRSGKTRRLPHQGREEMERNSSPKSGISRAQRELVRVNNRYVAYPVVWTQDGPGGSAVGPPTNARVFVFDAARGTMKYETFANEEVLVRATSLVLKRNGSVAWIYRARNTTTGPYSFVLKMDRATGGAETQLDRDRPGYIIDSNSLVLNRDTLSWTATAEDPPTYRTLFARLH